MTEIEPGQPSAYHDELDTCSVEGCDRHRDGRQPYCGMHDKRVKRHGDVNAGRQEHRAKSARELALAVVPDADRWPEGLMRTCKGKCGRTLPITEFAKGDKGRPRLKCLDCTRTAHREWRHRNKEHVREWERQYNQNPERKKKHRDQQRSYYWNNRDYQRDINLRQNYGISLEQYNALLELQDGVCAICKREDKSGRALAVDHDGECGKVRGLLCMNCNRAIGWLEHNPVWIEDALDYVLNNRHSHSQDCAGRHLVPALAGQGLAARTLVAGLCNGQLGHQPPSPM